MSTTLKPIAAPNVEPISLDTAKLHLRVDHDEDDALIAAIIVAAREMAEHETGRPLIEQVWEVAMDAFPEVEILLPKVGVMAIQSVTYVDGSGAAKTLASSKYSLDSEDANPWLLPAIDTTWPDTLDTANAVRVRFTCGYGPSADDVPAGIKAWMLLQIGALYRNREAFAQGASVAALPGRFCESLLDPHRVYGL